MRGLDAYERRILSELASGAAGREASDEETCKLDSLTRRELAISTIDGGYEKWAISPLGRLLLAATAGVP